MSKSALLKNSKKIIEKLKKNQEIINSEFVAASVSYEFSSDLVPNYISGEFKIQNYSDVKESQEIVYSDIIMNNGLHWRLKVYPNGNGNAVNTYLSVFLEMIKGHKESNKYEYRIEMIHPTDPSLKINREYSSDFEIGECWGYNRFYRISSLKEEGYITDE